MTEFIGREKYYLPIEIQVPPGGAGTKTTGLVADRNVTIFETKLGGEFGKGRFYKF